MRFINLADPKHLRLECDTSSKVFCSTGVIEDTLARRYFLTSNLQAGSTNIVIVKYHLSDYYFLTPIKYADLKLLISLKT